MGKEGELMGALNSLTETKIKRMAGDSIFSRGQKYFLNGHVMEIIKTEDEVIAKVAGKSSAPYFVRIREKGNKLESSCTCPYGGFCKHIVAVLLSLVKRKDGVVRINMKDVKDYLHSKGRDELVGMILDHASSDTDFMKSLFTEIKIKVKKVVDVPFFKREIDRRLSEADYVGYPNVYEYVCGLEQFAKQIQGLVKSGFAKESCELLFYFIRQSVDALENSGIDDSDGNFGGFIISLGDPCAKALRASGDKSVISAEEVTKWYLKAGNYGVEDCFDPILEVLPDETLSRLETFARERVQKLKSGPKSWQFSTERFFLAWILALRGKKEEYTRLCGEWGEKEWIAELKEVEKQRKKKHSLEKELPRF